MGVRVGVRVGCSRSDLIVEKFNCLVGFYMRK